MSATDDPNSQQVAENSGLEFTDIERDVFRRSLLAVVQGSFIADDEFQTIFCLRHAELKAIATDPSPLDISSPHVRQAIRSAMNALIMWAGWQDDDWEGAEETVRKLTGAPIDQMEKLVGRLHSIKPQKSAQYMKNSIFAPVQRFLRWMLGRSSKPE